MEELSYYNSEAFPDFINDFINEEVIFYSAVFLLKKIDIMSEVDHFFEVPLLDSYQNIELSFDYLSSKGLIEINTLECRYQLTNKGVDFIDNIIDEVESYIHKYEVYNDTDRVRSMIKDKVDILKVRFLWGLYNSEFDDLINWYNDKIKDIDGLISINNWQDIIVNINFYLILVDDILTSETDENYLYELQNNCINPKWRMLIDQEKYKIWYYIFFNLTST